MWLLTIDRKLKFYWSDRCRCRYCVCCRWTNTNAIWMVKLWEGRFYWPMKKSDRMYWFVWKRCWKIHISFVRITIPLKYSLFIVGTNIYVIRKIWFRSVQASWRRWQTNPHTYYFIIVISPINDPTVRSQHGDRLIIYIPNNRVVYLFT